MTKRPMTFQAGFGKSTGAALVVTLMLLLVMTLLAVMAMRTTSLEEKMAGNMRNHSIAFQAAESALRDAEAYIETMTSINNFTCDDTISGCTLPGLYEEDSLYQAILANATSPWVDPNGSVAVSGTYTGTLAGVNTQARYFIAFNAEVISDDTPSLSMTSGYETQNFSSPVSAFTIVARGTGGTDNTSTTLVSHYGKIF